MNLNLPLILFITFKVIVLLNKLSSSAQPKYVTLSIAWFWCHYILRPIFQFCYSNFAIFQFFNSSFEWVRFLFAPDLYVEMINMYHLHICIICIGKKITIYSDISLICNRNNKDPRMNLCGTLKRGSAEVENLSSTLTRKSLLDRYDLN